MSKPLHIADELFVAIKATCKERDIHPTEYIGNLIAEQAIDPTVAPVELVTEYMMARLDHGQQELLTVLCKENHSTPLEYIIGYCHLAFEQGQTSFLARPKDDLEQSLLSNAKLASQTFICHRDACGKEFTPFRDGQLYCSNTCGQIEHTASVARRSAERVAEPSEYAPTLNHATIRSTPESPSALAALTEQVKRLTDLVTASTG